MAVADLIVSDVFAGRFEPNRDSPEAATSLRELVRLLAGDLSQTTLHRALWAHHVRATTPGVPSMEHLTVAHYYLVRRLDPEQRRELLVHASEEGWSARELEHAVRRAHDFVGGKPRKPPALKSIEALGRVGWASLDPPELAVLSDEQRAIACTVLHGAATRIAGALETLETTPRQRGRAAPSNERTDGWSNELEAGADLLHDRGAAAAHSGGW